MGEKWKQWQTLFSWAPKPLQTVTVAMKLSHLLLGKKAMTNLDSILKGRDITLMTKVYRVKPMIFPVIMYRCESWTMKSECQRIDAFELWCCRKLLKVPWTARRSNQSILEEIKPEYSLEGLMLKLKLQYLGHPMCGADLLGETLMLQKIEGRRRKGWQKMRWLNDIINSVDMSSSKLLEIVKDKESMGSQSLTRLSDWTKKTWPQGDSSTHELY